MIQHTLSYFDNLSFPHCYEVFFLIRSLCLGSKKAKTEAPQSADVPSTHVDRIPSTQWLKIHTLSRTFIYLYSVNELVFCNHHFLQLAKVCIHFYSVQLGC